MMNMESTLPKFAGTYPSVSAAQLEKMLEKTVAEGHPYLFGRKSDFDRVRENCFGKNKFLTAHFATVRNNADRFLNVAPIEIKIDFSSQCYIGRGFEGWEIVMKCAFVYLITGETEYAERAYREAEYFCELNTWGTFQYIDNNQTAFAVALCYDWLYNYLTPTRREKLSSALCEKHLDTVLDLFRNQNAPQYARGFFQFYFHSNNHAVLDNCSVFVQALAIADRDIKASAELMAHTLKNLEPAFDNMYPDGVWYEGVSYWGFVGPFVARMLSAMESAFGTCLGYENVPHIANESDFPLYAQSSGSYVVYSDSTMGARTAFFEKFYFGRMKKDVALMNYSIRNDEIQGEPLLCLWYDINTDFEGAALELDRDKLLRNLDMAIMRDTFEGNQETYAALVVARPNKTHGFMSCGTIGFDALGKTWITAPGDDCYRLPGYWDESDGGKRWRYYFSRAEANNCIVINPSSQGGQNASSEAVINTFVSENAGAFAVSDMTDTYKGQVSSYYRGIKLDKNRTRFTLQDEIVLSESSEVFSFINFYKSNIEISDDMKFVTVSDGIKKLRVNIVSDAPFEICKMDSVPLPESDLLPGGKKTDELKKIALHFKNAEKINMKLEIVPYLFDEEITESCAAELVPMSDWKIEGSSSVRPRLTDLTIDGVTIEGFSPYNRYYTASDGEIKAYADGFEVSIEKTEKRLYKIKVSDRNEPLNFNTYAVILD